MKPAGKSDVDGAKTPVRGKQRWDSITSLLALLRPIPENPSACLHRNLFSTQWLV